MFTHLTEKHMSNLYVLYRSKHDVLMDGGQSHQKTRTNNAVATKPAPDDTEFKSDIKAKLNRAANTVKMDPQPSSPCQWADEAVCLGQGFRFLYCSTEGCVAPVHPHCQNAWEDGD